MLGPSATAAWLVFWSLQATTAEPKCHSYAAAGPEAELSVTGYAGGDSPGGAEVVTPTQTQRKEGH